jgi:antitoxin component of MazEF toxin-antitoxin module
MIRKLIRIGNSHGITLDKRMLMETGLESVTYLAIEIDKQGKKIIVRKRRENEW